MGTLRLSLAALLVMLCIPAITVGQWIPSFQSLGVVDLGNIQVSTSARFGYQHMGVNINLPVPFTGVWGNQFHTTSALDLRLRDAGLWTGGILVDARQNSISAFLSAEGNVRTNVRVETPSDPFWWGEHLVTWRGSSLEWWAIGGGGTVNVQRNLSAVCGMRLEHLSLKLADPVEPFGYIAENQALYGDRYYGDLRTKLWMPYVGMQVDGLNYRGKLLFSPVAWADVTIPFRYIFIYSPMGHEEARYHFTPQGLWLAADLLYETRVLSSLGCSIWFKGSWLQIRGRGREGYHAKVVERGRFLLTDSGSADGSLTSYVLAVGLCGTWTF